MPKRQVVFLYYISYNNANTNEDAENSAAEDGSVYSMENLTAIVLTRNEEKNIADCLKSVEDFASRVIVVDSHSTDRTVELARALGAEVLVHTFETHARQFNWALDHVDIQTEWVLRIDADERMTEAVKAECAPILAQPKENGINGIAMEAVFYMLGKALRFGGPKKRKLMIFRNGEGRIEDRFIDEHTMLLSGRAVKLKAKFDHYDFKSIDHFASKLNWYASREVMDILRTEDADRSLSDEHIRRTRKLKSGLYYRVPKFLRAFLIFIFRYVFQLGFLDGKPGLIYHFMYSFMYRFLVDAKLYEAEKMGLIKSELTALEAKE